MAWFPPSGWNNINKDLFGWVYEIENNVISVFANLNYNSVTSNKVPIITNEMFFFVLLPSAFILEIAYFLTTSQMIAWFNLKILCNLSAITVFILVIKNMNVSDITISV